ncbi:hepatocellular carcinoma-associated antigen 66 [Lophiotrema nucula]|uniref:Hepatocellular carcinoma-associated antigen 66 n=1 Tax=Lophiotrema nucula TaxID=690887 RepID=A0A6A5ZQ13_9PLEO|nr:hepatocellular carcinoma-associated antigen 66 [Lophiotrema nucula]
MAGPSDKARFYLESTVDELNELERKKIFSREEITSIAKKRSDFEHIINARGSHPSDYVRYIEYEKNLDALRRKRIKRLGVRSTGSGQRTIFFIFNRATRKFSGDLDLWFMYIEFARKEKAYKKLNEIFTSVVRLHPTNPDVWTYAAKYFMDTQADITNARSYMQRGLRFCKNSEYLWLEYAKLETIYIGKIAGRRKILGLDSDRTQAIVEDDGDADMIALPSITAEDINPSLRKEDGVDEIALHNLASAPVLTGAIPIAVFDSAMKQFKGDAELAEQFFGMFAGFDQLPCLKRILQHILDFLQQKAPEAVHTAICEAGMRLLGLQPTSPDFPSALGDSLEIIESALGKNSKNNSRLSESAIRQLLPFLRACDTEMTDPAIETVLVASLHKYTKLLGRASEKLTGDAIADLVGSLQRDGKAADAARLVQSSMKKFGSNERLQRYREALDT